MRRTLLLAVAGLLSASALLAVGILLFGRFGETEGRILATTALLAGYGVLALPAAVLLDRGRLRPLAAAVAALALAAAAFAVASVWSGGSNVLGKLNATATVFLLASAQTAALAARAGARDPRSVRVLFVVSTALAFAAAGTLTGIVWAEVDSPDLGRVVGAVVVLDVLAAALQPLLARARAAGTSVVLRIHDESGASLELAVDASDLAAAAARAIRATERSGRRVRDVEVLERHGV